MLCPTLEVFESTSHSFEKRKEAIPNEINGELWASGDQGSKFTLGVKG